MTRGALKENLVLIGFMGSGKSAVSRMLSRRCQMENLEMDRQIEVQEGRTITEIFHTDGEAYFRNLETELLIRLQQKKHLILSCGGGVPLREVNVREMKKIGKVVLLTAEPETVFERVRFGRNRPLLAGRMNVEYIASLMEERREKYLAAADLIIATDGKSIEAVCEEIVNKLEEKEKDV